MYCDNASLPSRRNRNLALENRNLNGSQQKMPPRQASSPARRSPSQQKNSSPSNRSPRKSQPIAPAASPSPSRGTTHLNGAMSAPINDVGSSNVLVGSPVPPLAVTKRRPKLSFTALALAVLALLAVACGVMVQQLGGPDAAAMAVKTLGAKVMSFSAGSTGTISADVLDKSGKKKGPKPAPPPPKPKPAPTPPKPKPAAEPLSSPTTATSSALQVPLPPKKPGPFTKFRNMVAKFVKRG